MGRDGPTDGTWRRVSFEDFHLRASA